MLYYSNAIIRQSGYHNAIRITTRIFKKTKNKLSKSEIKKSSGLSAKKYEETIKAFGINFYDIKKLVNSEKGNLIADFMLIPAHGNDFVYPYNPIYDYSKNCYHNCLVIMFICFESKGKIYPILFDYWISKIYYDDNEKYITKNELFIESIEYFIKNGLNIENIIFDSGFFNKNILTSLSKFNINLVTRCPKGRVFTSENIKMKVNNAFSNIYNGSFYYYDKYSCFLKSKTVEVFDISGQIIAIANNKKNLLEKKFFFLFTNNLDITHVKTLQIYKCRWKIESFFKLLKSYLSLSVFHRNSYDYVNQFINLALAGFFVVQDIASNLNISFYRALKQIQDENIDYLFFDSFKNTSKYFCYYV